MGGSSESFSISSTARALANLLMFYTVGLALLLLYMALLALGTRGILGLSSPGRELFLAAYGALLTLAWLYAWWASIKTMRRALFKRLSGEASF